MRSVRPFTALVLGGALLSACTRSGTIAEQGSVTAPTSAPRCLPGAPAQAPMMVVDWPSTELAAYEAIAKSQNSLIVLGYDGCRMQIQSQCRARGAYRWTATSGRREAEAIRSSWELSSKLLFWGAHFETALARSGELLVDMFVNGEQRSDHPVVLRPELEGVCARATHVVTAMQLGAFYIRAGQRSSGNVAVTASAVAGGAAGGSASADVLTQSCPGGSPMQCWQPLRIELAAIEEASAVTCPVGKTWDGHGCSTPPEQRAYQLFLSALHGGACRSFGIGGCKYHVDVQLGGGGPVVDQLDAPGFTTDYEFQHAVPTLFLEANVVQGIDVKLTHAGAVLGDKFLAQCTVVETSETLRELSEGGEIYRQMICGDQRTLVFRIVRKR